MNPSKTFSVAQVADYLGCSDTTVRNYTNDFAFFLNPQATPGHGQARYYISSDLAILKLAKQLRDNGVSVDDIAASLKMGQHADLHDLITSSNYSTTTETESDLHTLSIRLRQAKQELASLQQAHEQAQQRLQQARLWRERMIRLEEKLLAAQSHQTALEQQVQVEREQNAILMMESARGQLLAEEMTRLQKQFDDTQAQLFECRLQNELLQYSLTQWRQAYRRWMSSLNLLDHFEITSS